MLDVAEVVGDAVPRWPPDLALAGRHRAAWHGNSGGPLLRPRAPARLRRDPRAGCLPEVETVPWGERAGDRVDVDRLRYGCRLAAELGADVVKTEFPGRVTAMSA